MEYFIPSESLKKKTRIKNFFTKLYLIHIFLTPFEIYTFSFGQFRVFPQDIFFIILGSLSIIFLLTKSKIPNIGWIGGLHLAFIIVSGLGIIGAENQINAIQGTLVYLTKYFPGFLFSVYFLFSKNDVRKAVITLVIVCTINAIMGWIELIGFFVFHQVIYPPFASFFKHDLSLKAYGFGSVGAFSIEGFMRMYGFFNEMGDSFGTFNLIGLFLSLYLKNDYKERKIKPPLLFKISFFVLSSAQIICVSRNAYLGFIVAYTWFFFFKNYYERYPSKFILKIGIFLIFFCMSIFTLYLTRESDIFTKHSVKMNEYESINRPIQLLKRVNPFVKSESTNTDENIFTSHFLLAIKYCLTNFGVGLGPGNFDDYIWARYPIIYGSHSNLIITLGDTGIIGFIIQMFILGNMLVYSLYSFRSQNRICARPYKEYLPLYLGALYIGLFFTGVVRTNYMGTHTFIIGGLIFKYYLLQKKEIKNHENSDFDSGYFPRRV